MAFNGSGTFNLAAGNPVVSGTTISSTVHNNTLSEIAAGLSTCVLKDGQQTLTAAIPFNSQRLTGLGDATAVTDAAKVSQVQNSAYINVGSVSGTNTVTGTLSPTPAAYASGQLFLFKPANDNTGATTVNLNSLGAKSVKWNGAALTGGELNANVPALVRYNGTDFDLLTNVLAAGLNANGVTLTGATNLNAGTHRKGVIDLQNNTLTIVANATTSYDDNQQAIVWSSHASGGTVTAASGVDLNGTDGGSATVAQGESFGLYRKGSDNWWLFNAEVA